MQNNKNDEAKFDTSEKRRLQIWDKLQTLQADLCFEQEVSAYYMSDHWIHHAKTVLDTGTGNGYFLHKISELFPQKKYYGVDISKELISIAKSNFRDLAQNLDTKDYFNVEGKYDFIIMRLFWQHLPMPHIDEAFNKLDQITTPGASVLITDAYDKVRHFVPPLKNFQKIITSYTKQQNESKRNRDIISILKDKANASDKWVLRCELPIILPSSLYGKMKLYQSIYPLWIELFESLGELKIDFEPAKKELSRWQNNKGAFTQAGIRVIRLDKVT